jgi:hypothetical protein
MGGKWKLRKATTPSTAEPSNKIVSSSPESIIGNQLIQYQHYVAATLNRKGLKTD